MNKVTEYQNSSRGFGSTELAARKNPASSADLANRSRRRFMRINLIGLALAPAANLVFSESANAVSRRDGVPALLDASDPQAQALNYTAQGPKGQQSCSNCQLYTGASGKEFGPCALFSYRSDTQSGKPLVVTSTGWCRAWAPRQV